MALTRPTPTVMSKVQWDFSSFSDFESADLSDVPEGGSVEVEGVTYVKDSSQTFIPGLDGWRFPWQKQKHLLSADWQPRDDAAEVTRMQATMDSIAARHPDLMYSHVLGDLVTRGLKPSGDTPSLWGFPEFLADWRVRIPVPLHRAFFLAGNHDRNDTQAGTWEGASSMSGYRMYFGPEYYYTVQGNLLFLYLGDMGGGVAGAITDSVVEWAGAVLRRNSDKNIIIGMHHPLSGVYQGETEATDPDAVQARSSRITDILDEIAAGADNIAAVFFGHVGSSNQFNDETHHGTRHIQIGMHLPSNVDNGRNDQYYTFELVHGATSFTIEQWDATADVLLSTKSVDFTYPLQLGPEVVRYFEEDTPATYAPHISIPLDTHREEVSPGVWSLRTGEDDPLPVLKLGASDRSNDSTPEGTAIGIRWDFPGKTQGSDSIDVTASQGERIAAAYDLLMRTGGTTDDPVLSRIFRAWDNTAMLTLAVLNPDGVHVGHDGVTSTNPGNTGDVGTTLSPNGFVSSHRDGGLSAYFGREQEGDILEINVNGTRQGVIGSSNSRMYVEFGTDGPFLTSGTGTPEGSVSAPVGSLYMREDGGAGTSMYVKESGTGNTGWVAK